MRGKVAVTNVDDELELVNERDGHSEKGRPQTGFGK